jgi:23S rRNA pseudouridine1911/1915/1917 synthase
MTVPSRLERQVADEELGCRLDVFLARQPEVGSRSVAKALIAAGQVDVDGRAGKAGTSLVPGQTVVFAPRPEPEPAPADPAPAPVFELRVLHEDAFLVAIDKPAGIAVHPPDHGRAAGPCVTDLAVARFGPLPTVAGEDRPGIVHRLDKDTSGVMVLARTVEAFQFLQSQFKARTVRKEYRAICHGDPRFDSDWVEGNIAVDPRRGDRMAVVREGGKEASTYWEVIERFGDLCYVRCLPRSGRTHQIRVHLASVGHPLVGDRLYHAHRRVLELPQDAPDPGRHALHAWGIELLHPRTHEAVRFDAPVPEDMARLLRWLRERPRA